MSYTVEHHNAIHLPRRDIFDSTMEITLGVIKRLV